MSTPPNSIAAEVAAPSPWLTLIFPACILGVALALRVAGLRFGLPLAEARPDEMTIAFQAMKFGTGDLNPHSFNYPSLHKYLMFVLFGAWFVIGKVAGWFGGQEDFLRVFFDGAVVFRVLMRAWSAVIGTVGVALLLRFPHGRVAAILLAVAFLHVRDSHFGVTDITMVTLATAAVLACLSLQERGTVRAALWAGALAGLATSTKYNAGLLALPLALAAWFSTGPRLRLVVVGGAAMVAAFLAGTPYALLDSATFWHDFAFEAQHLLTGQFVDVGSGWVHHLETLWVTQGGLFLLVALGGGLVALRLEPRRALVLFSFPVVYYLAIGRGETAFFRYILPVLPFLCLAAAEALGTLPGAIVRLTGLALVMWPSLVGSLAVVRLMQAGDTRDAMGAWIEAHVPAESVIVHGGAYTGAPMLQRGIANQTREYEAKQGRADATGFRKPDDARWYNPSRPAYDVWFVDKPGIDYASHRSVESILADPPPYLLLEDYFLVHYSAVPAAIRDLAAARYTEIHEERATDGDVADPIFDQQDALYLPAAHFQGFTRMGPTLRLYQLATP